LVNRAAQQLAVGRVDEASGNIKKALSSNPQNSDALSLQSIIAVVQNNKDEALNLANKAVTAAPDSGTAQIALSYAQQANFDLEGARASLEKAVELEPDNALAWARLAELMSSFGDLDKALANAQKAVELDPNLSRTQTVLGFTYLIQIKTAAARDAFNKAIELDQADSLPRLGLGLAKIRDGELEDGRREIEIAASLDPNSSLIRSYLGKAYYEEKREDLDGREYEIAKELDPNDPTPWFYDAIRKQTINRPVEALYDLQKANDLNDNRAVYRSKLMLDSDQAARSAGLARIYSDLGFQKRALVEGYNSVNTDPTNHSAHRFLADSYSALPRHEIARVSELLQSQLLQPNNITPIQPALAESNLFLISSGGSANLSFNEFNPLFNRDRVAVQASGIVGENDTAGGEAVVSGIYKNFSFSAGYTHFETDGFRINNNQKDDIANVFAQYELTYKTSIQAEYRYRDSESGDLPLRFFEDEFMPNLEQEEESQSIRLGFRHTFAPGSDLIGNFQYTDGDRSLHDEIPDPDVTFPIFNYDLQADDDKALSGELSYLLRSKYLNLVGGAGYFDIDMKDEITLSLEFPAPPPLVLDQFDADLDVEHTNLYAYSYIKPLKNLTLTLGASYDDFKPEDDVQTKDENQFNPKFGITYSAPTGTTVRAAAFRVLKRTLITDQTLEPTQVAGFNQFFDEINATDYWLYGGALDQKFTNVFLGAEYIYRDLEVPFFDFMTGPTPNLTTVDWDEQILRAYLFWTPHKWLALSAEYMYEDLDRDQNFNLNVKDLETHYLPLGIKFFHPSGLSVSLKGTYVDQEGSFNRLSAPPGVTEDGEDDFWLLDTAISYRLSKRYGFITAGVSNLFDEDFEYFDSDPANPRIQPDRYFFARVTLALP
jgi:tetratricopeptide (TPR) repeat protein